MVADMGPEPEHHHHHHSGHRWLDVVLAVSAVIISLISLFLAIQHGRVMERMVEASTWPYVLVGYSNFNADGTPHVTLWVVNKGVGPARLDSLEVFYQDAPQTGPQALLKAILKPGDPSRHYHAFQSDVVNSVLSARESVNFLDLDAKSYDPADYSRIGAATEHLDFRACYCSVFEECSLVDTRKSPRPVAVKACPVPEKPFQH